MSTEKKKRTKDFNRDLYNCTYRSGDIKKTELTRVKRKYPSLKEERVQETGRSSQKYKASGRGRRKKIHLDGFDLAFHSINKYFWSTYYVPGTLAFILNKRQEPLQRSEESDDMI